MKLIKLDEQLNDGVLFLPGTDEWREWLHHIIPGARRREIAEAYRILDSHDLSGVHTIVGLSMGAAIAQIVAVLLLEQEGRYLNVYLIGGKRAPRGYVYYRAQSIRNRGDLITLLPPWRPGNPNQLTRGDWQPPWVAHAWGNYSDLLRRYGAI